MKFSQIFLFAWLMALQMALIFSVRPGFAHGEANMVALAQKLGPYKVTVFTTSTVNEEAHLHLSTIVAHPENDMPVMAAKVSYQIALLGDAGQIEDEIIRIEAGAPDPANGFLQEVNLTLPQAGNYLVEVFVSDPMGQGGQASFSVNVQPITVWTKIIIVAFLIQAVIMLLWLVKEGLTVWTPREATAPIFSD